MSFINALSERMQNQGNLENALAMKNYLRGQFEFYGIKSKPRREILKEVAAQYQNEIENNIRSIAIELMQQPQRELHHCGIELFEKYLRRSYVKNDITIITALVTNKSWWDTVDYIAKQILGKYLTIYPSQIETVIAEYSDSKNMWLNRSSILFQLGYKKKTDSALLYAQCLRFSHSDEFFIKKAIGWSLREYGKSNPQSVLNFVNLSTLKPLSHKEALRNIIKK
ncbi:MAG: DNA alkylation repair protein [Flavobacteriaceae bacterium]|nr:DNA alkylation repair protein [Flavobacteriaceae bacterium]